MTLDQEISLGTISKLFKKQETKTELKTEINFFAVASKEKKKISAAIPATIAAIVVVAVIGKFAIFDRYMGLFERQAQVTKIREDIATANEVLENSGELQERYYHYTTSMMTDEEKNMVKRTEVMELLRFMEGLGVDVSGATISGNVIVASVEAEDLKTLSAVSHSLEGQELVSTVSVTTAQTKQENITETAEGVNASVTIYLKTDDQAQEVEQ